MILDTCILTLVCSIAPQERPGQICVLERRMTAEPPIRGFRLGLHPRLSHVVHLRSTASKRLLRNCESRIPNAYSSVNSIVALGESYPAPSRIRAIGVIRGSFSPFLFPMPQEGISPGFLTNLHEFTWCLVLKKSVPTGRSERFFGRSSIRVSFCLRSGLRFLRGCGPSFPAGRTRR